MIPSKRNAHPDETESELMPEKNIIACELLYPNIGCFVKINIKKNIWKISSTH